MNSKLWIKMANNINKENFHKNLYSFYQDKTFERVKNYHVKNELPDKNLIINDIEINSSLNLLNEVPWDVLICKSIPSHFHGDFHNENIILSKNSFYLLDWRQNFGSDLMRFGDLYYDLAKFNHGLLVNHSIVNNGNFSVKWLNSNNVIIDIHQSSRLLEVEKVFRQWLIDNKFCYSNVDLLTSLIFL